MNALESRPITTTRSIPPPEAHPAYHPPAHNPHEGHILAHVLDEIACGVIITDSRCKLLHSNVAGQVILDRQQHLQLIRGYVSATESANTAELAQAVYSAAQGKRSMITLGDPEHAQPITVALVPLDRNANISLQTSASPIYPETPSLYHQEARIAFIFSRSGMCEQLTLSFFSRAHQLTRCEEQILGMLCAGLTAPEMAEQLRIGEATVRTHIRNICVKTHSNGIRDVLKRLALLPPLMAAAVPSSFA